MPVSGKSCSFIEIDDDFREREREEGAVKSSLPARDDMSTACKGTAKGDRQAQRCAVWNHHVCVSA